MPTNQAATAESPVTMGALQAMMDSFKLEMRAMIAESRSRSSLPAPQQPSPPSSNQATQSATQSITVQPVEDKRCPPSSLPPPSTPPAPQKAQKEEAEQLLQQATVENITESITKHPDSKSTLSTISRLCTAQSSGDSATCLNNLACLPGYTLPGYIEHSEGLEATGQGWYGHCQHGYKTEARTKATVCISAIRPWGHGHFCFLWAFVTDSFLRHPH